MRKLIVSMQMTLDGYVAAPDGKADWLITSEGDWAATFEDLQSVDTILVGRKMYPEYSGYWRSVLTDPKADANEKKYAEWADRTPHIVFSHSMKDVDWPNTRNAPELEAEVKKLKQQPGKDILAWGGATLAGELIRKKLANELRITLNPHLLGGGLSLFDNVNERQKLTLKSERPLDKGLVLLKYEL